LATGCGQQIVQAMWRFLHADLGHRPRPAVVDDVLYVADAFAVLRKLNELL